MIYLNIEAYLTQFVNLEKTGEFKYARDLTRMRQLLLKLGSPEKNLRIRLIAGSKGKTSTSHFLSQLLRQSDRSIGLYTSPHLTCWNERIQVNGVPVEEELIHQLLPQMNLALESFSVSTKPTYFEVTTALAYLYFQQAGVRDVVVEVGLGGTYDATNTCEPLLTVITAISLEHTAVLGAHLHQIAEEKSGVHRKKAPMIIGNQSTEILEFYLQKFQNHPAGIHCAQRDVTRTEHPNDPWSSEVNFDGPWGNIQYFNRLLLGKHQLDNLSTALLAVWNDPHYKVSDSVEFTKQMTFKINQIQPVPGRMQLLHSDPYILIDGSHNEASAEAMVDTILQNWNPKSVGIIVGMMRDKDPIAYMGPLRRLPLKQIIVTSTHHYRSYGVSELSQILSEKYEVQPEQTIQDAICALTNGLRALPEMLIVCGSLYLAGEALKNKDMFLEKVTFCGRYIH